MFYPRHLQAGFQTNQGKYRIRETDRPSHLAVGFTVHSLSAFCTPLYFSASKEGYKSVMNRFHHRHKKKKTSNIRVT